MRATWREEDGRWAFGIDSESAIELDTAEYEALIVGQNSHGLKISIGDDGRPCLVGYPAAVEIDPAAVIKSQIIDLERQQTARRLREAVLGIDDGWLSNLESQIAILRAQI